MNLLQDLKFAARSLRSHAGTTAFAAVTLALGLGAALAIYAVVDAVLLRDLPYPGADRLVQIRELADDGHAMNVAYPNYTDLVASADALDASAYYGGGDGPVSSGDTTTRAYGTLAGGLLYVNAGVVAFYVSATAIAVVTCMFVTSARRGAARGTGSYPLAQPDSSHA